MTELLEQRYCIKFFEKLGDTQVDTIRKIQQAFGDNAMSIKWIKEWYNRFKGGSTSVDSEPCHDRPSTSRNDNVINQVRALIVQDTRITVRELVDEVGVSIGSVHSILTADLGLRRVSAKFVPKLLTMEQKQLRLEIAQDMLDSIESDSNFLNTVITGDESWVYGYNPGTKAQSSQWKLPSSPRPKKAQQVCSNVKVLLTVFFDSRWVVHHEYTPQGQTVTKEYYEGVHCRLRNAVWHKWPDLWAAKSWQFHHDNAPAHSSHLIQGFLAKHNIPLIRQAPYSPDMAPCDFWLLSKLKMLLKGTRFESREDITRKVTAQLDMIPQEAFQKCFQQWQDCWKKCVHYQEDYFEGD